MTEKPNHTVEQTQQQPSPRLQAELEPRAPSRRRTHELVIALYERRPSARDVGELLDLPRGTVSGLVTRAGISRGRDEAVRLALRHRQVRTNVAHVTLLGDVVADVAAKLGITADLLLAVLADRLHTTDRTTNRVADRGDGRGDGHGDEVSGPVAERPLCVGVCSCGCTHRCARSTTPARTRLARLDLRPYARRWMDGTETSSCLPSWRYPPTCSGTHSPPCWP